MHLTAAPQMTSGSVYLPNGYQVAFNCDAVVPAKVAIAKASAYAKRRKRNIYVPGIGHFDEDGNRVDPTPPGPDPIVITIGNVTGSGDDVNEAGDNVSFDKDATSIVTAEFDGEAEDVTYKWEIRTGGDKISIVGDSTQAAVTLQGDDGGSASIRCTLASKTAGDSPQTLTMTVIVKEPTGP